MKQRNECPKGHLLAFAYYIFPDSNGSKHRISNTFYCDLCQKFELELIKQMAQEGLKKGVKNGFYYAYDNIKWTETQIQMRGTAKALIYSTWSNGPTIEQQNQQTTLEEFIDENPVVDLCEESCGR